MSRLATLARAPGIRCAVLSVTGLIHACHHGPLPTVPARIVADFSQGQVTLMGSLPNQAQHERLRDEAERRYGKPHVRDQVNVDERVIPAPWVESDALYFPLIDNLLSEGQAAFDGAQLIVTGETPSPSMRAQIEARIRTHANASIRVENHVQVLP